MTDAREVGDKSCEKQWIVSERQFSKSRGIDVPFTHALLSVGRGGVLCCSVTRVGGAQKVAETIEMTRAHYDSVDGQQNGKQ